MIDADNSQCLAVSGPRLILMPVSLDLVLLEVWRNGGQAIVASVLTAVILKAQNVRAEVTTHARLAMYVNDDLGRWVRDRDQVAASRVNEIRQDAAAKGVAGGGALAQARGKVYMHALREYRDEGARKLRAVDELADQERRLHDRWRRHRGQSMRRPRLPEDARTILVRWRQYSDEDVSRVELEPALVELEARER